MHRLLKRRYHHDTLFNDSIDWLNSVQKFSTQVLSTTNQTNGYICGNRNLQIMVTEWGSILREAISVADSMTRICKYHDLSLIRGVLYYKTKGKWKSMHAWINMHENSKIKHSISLWKSGHVFANFIIKHINSSKTRK